MPPGLGDALAVCFGSIGKLVLISLIGFIPVRRGWVGEDRLFLLVRIVVDTFVPVTIALALVKGFSPQAFAQGSVIVFFALAWIVGGLFLGRALLRLIPGGSPDSDRTTATMCSIQNSFYLPIPLVGSILPEHMRAEAMLYLGLAIFVTNPMQWTLGTYLLRGRAGEAPNWRETLRSTLNGPTIGVIAGCALALVPGLPEVARRSWQAPGAWGLLFGPAHLVSAAMAPVAMTVLGGLLGAAKLRTALSWRAVAVVVGVKLLITPLVCFILLRTFFAGWEPLVLFVVMLEAASPPAVNLALAARRFGGDWELCSTTMFPVYAVALFTMPTWVAVEMAILGLGSR